MRGTSAELRAELARRPLVLDGATGTELQRRGAPTALPLWSAAALNTDPDLVRAVHRDYVAAGADLLVANTFRTNPRTLRRAGQAENGPTLNRLAVSLARQAADTAAPDRTIWVAASVAPVEDCYRPELAPPEVELRAEHATMVEWLRAAGPDLLWIETIGTVREARAAAGAAAEAGMPFVVCFALREDGRLLGGESLEDAVLAVTPLGPLALGLNCMPPAGIAAALPQLRSATRLPLAAYAHIGNPEPTAGWSFSEAVEAREYEAWVRAWRSLGAGIIGGCCGTTPDHIRAVAAALHRSC
jgi:S-methylmethionine-dependent homocysteine/selenocysteine methylase